MAIVARCCFTAQTMRQTFLNLIFLLHTCLIPMLNLNPVLALATVSACCFIFLSDITRRRYSTNFANQVIDLHLQMKTMIILQKLLYTSICIINVLFRILSCASHLSWGIWPRVWATRRTQHARPVCWSVRRTWTNFSAYFDITLRCPAHLIYQVVDPRLQRLAIPQQPAKSHNRLLVAARILSNWYFFYLLCLRVSSLRGQNPLYQKILISLAFFTFFTWQWHFTLRLITKYKYDLRTYTVHIPVLLKSLMVLWFFAHGDDWMTTQDYTALMILRFKFSYVLYLSTV